MGSKAAKTTESSCVLRPEWPTLFDALRNQLGLRLQEKKGLVESMVIEQVERPTGN
jgi:uncharacterized protein (TIGR03435 family)